MKFKYLSYKNIYSFKSGDTSKSHTKESCFSNLFSNLPKMNKSENLNIVIYFAMDESLNLNGKNNMCFLSKSELAEFLRFTKKITGIKFKYEFTQHVEIDNACKVAVNTKNYTENQIKSLVSIIRCAYESPFSFQVKAAFAMKSIYGFKGMKFIDRFIIAMNSIIDIDNRYVHSIYCTNKILINDGIEKIKDRVINGYSVNNTILYGDVERNKIIIENNSKASINLANGIVNEVYLNKFKEVKKWKS